MFAASPLAFRAAICSLYPDRRFRFSTSRESLAMFGVFITMAMSFFIGATVALMTRLLLGVALMLSDKP
jgi:hypothetical protein